MISYELLKKCKDVGFPQDKITTSREGDGMSYMDSPNLEAGDWSLPYDQYDKKRDRAYIPTLEEAIEACASPKFMLDRPFPPVPKDKRWFAHASREIRSQKWKHYTASGDTPLEGVLNLWLAIHGK